MTILCPRCGYAQPPVDDAPAPFCAQCGLQQLRVADDATSPPQLAGVGLEAAASDPAESPIDWPLALRLIAVAGLLGVVPVACLPGALAEGLVGGMALLMMPLLTVAVASVYYRNRPQRPISSAVGTRIGATLGVLMGFLIALITGIAGFVMRYGRHSLAMELKFDETIRQLPAQITSAGPVPPEVTAFLQSPEFRGGSFILGHFLSMLLLTFAGAVCGWIAGTLLRARRQRHNSL